MLKLTSHNDENSALYVRSSHIIAMEALSPGTKIWIDHGTLWVSETPEEILAMPEMQYELYPPMMLVPDLDGRTARPMPMGPAERHNPNGMTFIR